MTDQSLKPHLLADQLPLMSSEEFEALKADISENGQKEPILLFQGKILDGRNRYKACQKLNLEPEVEHFDGSYEAAAKLSASANLLRRHLSKSQQGMFVVKAGLAAPPGQANLNGSETIRDAAKRYGVNHVTIYKAFYVNQHKPELADQVLRGELSVGSAEAMIRAELEGAEEADQPTAALGRTIKRLAALINELDGTAARKKRALKLLSELQAALE